LPTNVPANEYLNMEGFKLSTSRNWAVWLPDYLDRYEPDPLRYVITSNLPELSDSDFSWKEYVRANNDELVATYGNLIHRVLTMTYNYFDGQVPSNETIDNECEELLAKCAKTILLVGQSIEKAQFRKGLSVAMTLASDANKFLEDRKPWQTNKTDKEKTAASLWTTLSVINCLRIVMEPFLPFSSMKLKNMLGFSNTNSSNWEWGHNDVIPGNPIKKPDPLFKKLDDLIIEAEDAKLRA
jgi:methionyl-tRNA synthetase